MNIQILGHKALELHLKENPHKHPVIYYTQSDWEALPFVKEYATDSIHLQVDDIDNYGLTHYVAPKTDIIKKFLDFSKDKKELVVACHAGISRSSATAYVIAARDCGAEGALDVLEVGHHFPNRLIVYIGSKVLDNGNVWDKYVDWMRKFIGHDPSQDGIWPTTELICKI